MPKCAKCMEMLPPNFCTPKMDKTEEYFMCVFCEKEIKEITIDKKSGKRETYTKKQCKRDYKKLLNYMKEKTTQMDNISDAAKTFSESGLILPGSAEFEKTLQGK